MQDNEEFFSLGKYSSFTDGEHTFFPNTITIAFTHVQAIRLLIGNEQPTLHFAEVQLANGNVVRGIVADIDSYHCIVRQWMARQVDKGSETGAKRRRSEMEV